MTVSKSPERHTFQKNSYIERCKEQGREPDASVLQMYDSWAEEDQYSSRPENDLEFDLRTTDWILEKARTRDDYAQNIYAALCNMRWIKREMWPILKEEYWSCSWRSAGGIVADMLQKGDYIDWYCSGMGGIAASYEEDPDWRSKTGYVPEGTITEEIEKDLNKLGWIPSPWPKDDNI
jgi:hypothetical protein